MQEKYLFEYAVLRIVPRVEREEFLNVGVVLYCPQKKFLEVLYHLDGERIKAFACELDVPEIGQYLQAFDKICAATKDSGPIGRLSIADRFRWLTATRSTVVQTSRTHTGLCTDAKETLQHLYRQLVL
ncbi:MAG TPA: DUF3037 domain-containing protein [Chitinophagaceae bacterium]|nr:DUF3037 domain-containing protein [Chitinophagaceae bacterium]